MPPSCAGRLPHPAADHRAPDRNVPELFGRAFEWIGVKYCEIRKLADLDTADDMIELEGIGRADRDRSQRLLDADSLGRAAEHASPRGYAVDRAPGSEQRVERGDRRVGMDGVRHPDTLRRPGGIETRSPLGSHRQVVV